GVQSFDPLVQKAINRVQSFEQTAAATHGLREVGVAGINFDLIYGLPHQNVASCLDTVRRSIELRPDRLSVFGYAHVPSFKTHQRKIQDTALPDSLERYDQACVIGEALKDAGNAVSWILRWCRSEEHTSELQSHLNLVCRLLLEQKKTQKHS